MKNLFYILLFIFSYQFLSAQTADYYLNQADSLFKVKEVSESLTNLKAKEYYQKAYELGSADAAFKLTYRFIIKDQNIKINFLEFATKKGHSKATENLFETMFSRAETIWLAEPRRMSKIYKRAKEVNPYLSFYGKESLEKILKIFPQVPEFDVKKFIKKYKIVNSKSLGGYGVLELAEEASKNGRFGKANMLLTLQLIIRGGSVPAEYYGMVFDYYEYWQNNKIVEFDICNYASSKLGIGYCTHRETNK